MKTIVLSIETAKLLYKSSEAGKAFALDNYTKEELETKELPKTWEELEKISGYSTNFSSNVVKIDHAKTNDCVQKNIFVMEEQANASIAMAQLSQLKAVYNDGWIPNYTTPSMHYCIEYYDDALTTNCYSITQRFLSFKTREIREEFLKNFKDLIEQAKPLL